MASPYPTLGVVASTDLTTNADVFPQLPGQDFVLSKKPTWSTGVKRSVGGREIRSAYYSSPLYTFKVQMNMLRGDATNLELQKLLGFFNSRQGRYGFFYYYDPEDSVVTDEPFATGDGTTTTFQLARSVGRGTTYPALEPVYACWIAPTFKAAGSVVSASVGQWGAVTFSSAPASGAALTWTGKILYVCRFDQDDMDLAQMASLMWSQGGLQFVSIRP